MLNSIDLDQRKVWKKQLNKVLFLFEVKQPYQIITHVQLTYWTFFFFKKMKNKNNLLHWKILCKKLTGNCPQTNTCTHWNFIIIGLSRFIFIIHTFFWSHHLLTFRLVFRFKKKINGYGNTSRWEERLPDWGNDNNSSFFLNLYEF